MSGWIKIHRKILEWEWYNDNNTKVVFLHLLLTANHKEKEWRGITVKRGELITSTANLASQLGLTTKQIRRCLDNLKSTGELGMKRASNGAHLTLCNYNSYQDSQEDEGQTLGISEGTKRATTKEVKKERREEEKKKDKDIAPAYSSEFEGFWKVYGRKGNKAKSWACWKKLSKQDIETIRERLPAYLYKTRNDLTFRKDAQTYLNPTARHFEDVVYISERAEQNVNNGF